MIHREAKKISLIAEILKIENEDLLDKVRAFIYANRTVTIKQIEDTNARTIMHPMLKTIGECCELADPLTWK